ncbi:4-hydroxy-tetrahydrodipicolinate synthase [Gillisia sp. Q332]|uniref:4-hydroxy-tetrahydrodipicolinate synthase n=1 Tax=Gillisia xinjiangensis TaxID=3384765 RepID=UPI00391BFAA7
MNKLIGTGVALITPFKNDLTVDQESLAKLVKNQIANGINYLVVLGTTAEVATLTKAEKKLVIDTVIKANNSQLPLVLGIGGNNTAALVEELSYEDLSAFEAVLSVSPYYNKPTQEGIYQHYKALSEASPKPIIIYNVPGRTASNVLPATIKRLAEDFHNIIGIKEAAGDMVQAMKLIAMVPEGFLVISGDDMITLPMILAGGHGVISVIGQGFPAEFSEMVKIGLESKVKEAYKLHYKIAPSIDLIFSEGNPAGIKSLLHSKGLCEEAVRLPLMKASEKLKKELSRFVEAF